MPSVLFMVSGFNGDDNGGIGYDPEGVSRSGEGVKVGDGKVGGRGGIDGGGSSGGRYGGGSGGLLSETTPHNVQIPSCFVNDDAIALELNAFSKDDETSGGDSTLKLTLVM